MTTVLPSCEAAAIENQRVDQAVSESLSVPAPLVRSIEPPPVAPDDGASVAPVFEPAVTLNDDQASGAQSIGAAASPAESLKAPQEEPEAEPELEPEPVPTPQPTVDEADEPGMKKLSWHQQRKPHPTCKRVHSGTTKSGFQAAGLSLR